MTCAACREAVSATLDRESSGVPQQWVDEHLAGCAGCRGWAEAAAEVTRRARLVAAPAVPDVTAAVLGRLPAAAPRDGRSLLDPALRLALLLVGVGQLVVSLAAFSGGSGDMPAPVHLAHETGAWNLGLAACFLWVAGRPGLAAGSLPFLLPFSAALGWLTVADLGEGHVHAGRAVVHLLLLGGVLLVGVLALRNRAPRTGPTGRRSPSPGALWTTIRAARGGAPAAAGRHPRPAGPVLATEVDGGRAAA